MTSYVFMWESPDGERHWEAVEKGQTRGFMEKLLNDGVHPATAMVAYAPILFHWVWPEFHKGLSDVNFHAINEEIYGTGPAPENKHEPVDVPIEKEKPAQKLGWIAPDGRHFACEYGGHTSLASKIVGEIQYVYDPERHLEDLGWAKIFKSICTGERYSVGMGRGKRLTGAQVKTLQSMGLERATGVSLLL